MKFLVLASLLSTSAFAQILPHLGYTCTAVSGDTLKVTPVYLRSGEHANVVFTTGGVELESHYVTIHEETSPFLNKVILKDLGGDFAEGTQIEITESSFIGRGCGRGSCLGNNQKIKAKLTLNGESTVFNCKAQGFIAPNL